MRLRARIAQELLALAGIVVGVALVFSALVANASLTGSVRQLSDGVFGGSDYQLVARGPTGFPASTLHAVAMLAGVRGAAPYLEARGNVVGPSGRRSVLLVGGDPRLARIGGSFLRDFTDGELSRQRLLAIPAPLSNAIGAGTYQRVNVETGAGTTTLRIGAELQHEDIGTLVYSPVVVMPMTLAQEVLGMRGRYSRIVVEAVPGREREVATGLERIAGDELSVWPTNFDVDVFERAAYPTSQSTAMFSLFSALVGFLFAFTAVLLTVGQRRRLVADLRLAGYPPWVQVQVMLFDALVLGTLGSLLGLLLGNELSARLFDTPPGYLAFAFPIGTQRFVTWQVVAIAALAGIVAACVAVLAPLRDILARHEPVVEQRRSRWNSGIAAWAGAGLLGVTTVILVLRPEAAVVGLVALTLALLLMLPVLLGATTRGFARLTTRVRSPVPILAAFELRSSSGRTRTLALAATGAIAVFATVAIGGAHADLERGLDAAAADVDANGDLWVTLRSDTSTYAVIPFTLSEGTADAIGAVAGVQSVGIYRGSFLDVGDRRAWVQAPPRSAALPVPPSQLREGDAAEAAARLRAGGSVVLSEAIARQLGVGVGDSVLLPTPRPQPLRVAAISTNIGWPSGAIVMNADDYAQRWFSQLPSALQVRLAPGADPDTVAVEVRERLRDGVATEVETQATRLARHRAATRDGLERLTQISVLVLVSAMLAMAAAMGGMIWQRRPALAALKVHGFPEGELWRALLLESGLLLGTGCLIGALFGLYGQLLLSRALETITGFPVVYSTAGVVAVAILALVTTVAVAMLAIPGWLAVRVRPSPSATT